MPAGSFRSNRTARHLTNPWTKQELKDLGDLADVSVSYLVKNDIFPGKTKTQITLARTNLNQGGDGWNDMKKKT